MAETRDWAKVGKTTWRADILFDDGDDPRARTLASVERPNLGLAKAWVNRHLPQSPQDGRPWAEIRRGTYADESFDDHRYGDGHVLHASWEADQNGQWYAQLAEDGLNVDWQED